ncbi:sensor histidine kinase [Streptomyces sp. VRA16 Mangrove soil]|uniref:sensor histidine kinase n=1 Tax=Streptomyces sp. VRA16 Mangrove soil TaxID=2817434 RepID=UPI001A9DFE59|nr:sensor histidine kinase [Streptomyces sp. VRA16 Mangrove soil]MBO1330531.1 sensor domain-containing protein [Streptomyces sp. VRA16 Mangrove soil]
MREVLRAWRTRRAWAEAVYCLLCGALAVTGFVLVVVALALGAAFTLTLIGAVLGVLFLVGGLTLARGLGGLQRALAGGLLGERVATPGGPRAGGGLFGRTEARLRDAAAWRAVAYVTVRLPVALFGLYAVSWWAVGAVNVVAPVRWALAPDDVHLVTPLPFGGSPQVHSVWGALGTTLAGCAIVVVAPWLTRAFVSLDRRLVRALLGPDRLAQRVRDLEETRALAVEDAAERLRRLERDLHDGAQVRLVALAMSLDMVREQLDDRDRPELRRLVETARDNAAEALTELRDLSHGLHPPALDGGLGDALTTLAARSALPVDVTVEVPVRPSPAIESLAYYCAAELLTNAIKHSGATRIGIELVAGDGVLRVRVSDDGRGGARIVAGGGLAGLVQRVRTVDGELAVSSPEGGPTSVTIRLPEHA